GPVVSGRGAPGGCKTRLIAEDTLDFFQLTADDSGVKRTLCDPRMLFEQTHRCMKCHAVRGTSTHVMIGTGVLEEMGDDLRLRLLPRLRLKDLFQSSPTGLSELQRKRVLDITQNRLRRSTSPSLRQTLACFRIIGAQRLEPSLRFFFEIVESCLGR